MNPNRRISSRQYSLDTVGIWTSLVCAVHCLFLPVVLSMSAFSSLVFLHDPVFEAIILSVSVMVGTGSLFPAYRRHHQKLTAIGIFLFGFLLIGLSRVVSAHESLLTASGAAMVALAHFVNFRLCKKAHREVV